MNDHGAQGRRDEHRLTAIEAKLEQLVLLLREQNGNVASTARWAAEHQKVHDILLAVSAHDKRVIAFLVTGGLGLAGALGSAAGVLARFL